MKFRGNYEAKKRLVALDTEGEVLGILFDGEAAWDGIGIS